MTQASEFPRRGEIWYIHTPGQPVDPHQPRPGLVISGDIRNRRRDHLIVVPIYSAGPLGPTRVPLSQGTGGIDHDSVLFCEELATIDRYFLADGPLGPPVSEGLLDLVVAAINIAVSRSG